MDSSGVGRGRGAVVPAWLAQQQQQHAHAPGHGSEHGGPEPADLQTKLSDLDEDSQRQLLGEQEEAAREALRCVRIGVEQGWPGGWHPRAPDRPCLGVQLAAGCAA